MAENSCEPDKSSSDTSAAHSSDSFSKRTKHEFPQSQVGKLWDAFGKPEEPINVMPGATYNPTCEKPNKVTFSESISSTSLKDLTTFHKAPCARDSLLLGIGAGFGIGGIRGIIGGIGSIWPACNWAVGAFAIASIAAHEFCQRRRALEIDGMKQAVEMMQQLKIKKQREKEQKRVADEAARRRVEEEERKQRSWTNLSNYKFW